LHEEIDRALLRAPKQMAGRAADIDEVDRAWGGLGACRSARHFGVCP
jgi:hypothetical protein